MKITILGESIEESYSGLDKIEEIEFGEEISTIASRGSLIAIGIRNILGRGKHKIILIDLSGERTILEASEGSVTALALSQDLIASGDLDRLIIWNTSGNIIREIPSKEPVEALAFYKNYLIYAFGEYIYVHNISKNKLSRKAKHGERILSLSVSSFLAAGGEEHVYIRSLPDLKLINKIPVEKPIYSIHARRLVAAAEADLFDRPPYSIYLIDPSRGVIDKVETEKAVRAVRFSPGDSRIAIGSDRLLLMNISTRESISVPLEGIRGIEFPSYLAVAARKSLYVFKPKPKESPEGEPREIELEVEQSHLAASERILIAAKLSKFYDIDPIEALLEANRRGILIDLLRLLVSDRKIEQIDARSFRIPYATRRPE